MGDFSKLFDDLEENLNFPCKQSRRKNSFWVDLLPHKEEETAFNENVITA